jgi:hypothetical protein
MKTAKLKVGKSNPRQIKDDRFEKLKKSIQEFPKMMELRPIVYDPDTMEVLGGNMRLRAIKDLGMSEIPDTWVRSAAELTDEERKRFIIADNVPFGEWDDDLLKSWDPGELEDWGIDLEEPEETHKEKTEQLTDFKRAHVLISYDPDRHIEVMEAIELLREFCEIETASN